MTADKFSTLRLGLVAVASAALVLTGCSAAGSHGVSTSTPISSSSSSATTPPSASAGAALEAVHTALGQVLADARGYTVYTFAHDKAGVSTCTGACATMWPPLLVNAGSQVRGAAGVSGVLSTSTRPGGEVQATWNGHPLYTFSGDTAPGQTHGQGIKGLWSVVPAASTKVTTKPASTSVMSSTTRRAAPTSAGPAPSTPTMRTSSARHTTKPPSSSHSTTTPPTNCIPQGGGGDGDGDNSGGPTDGDGCT